MLAAQNEARSFLERPAAEFGVTGGFAPAPEQETATALPCEAAGTMIGPWSQMVLVAVFGDRDAFDEFHHEIGVANRAAHVSKRLAWTTY
jgi:hypothetical protein